MRFEEPGRTVAIIAILLIQLAAVWQLWRTGAQPDGRAGILAILVATLLLTSALWIWDRLVNQVAGNDLRESRERLAGIVESLRESEERFRLIADTAPIMLWMSNPDNLYTYFNRSWLEFTGRSLEAESGTGWFTGVHPDDLRRWLPISQEAFAARQPFTVEYRLRQGDGQYRWIRQTGVPRFLSTGAFAGYIGSAVDFTSHKVAEESLASMGHKMLEAHEIERNGIARELHDDIGQRMAVLTIELDGLSGDRPVAAGDMRVKIRAIADQAHDLAQDIQAISHSLHSSKLEYLGLVSASAGFCREVFDQQGLDVRFTSHDIPDDLPKDVAFCMYRVLQEAVNNATKHAGAQHVTAALRGDAAEVHLEVADDGTGFDPEAPLTGAGLGLISMRERLALVGGEMTIQSRPGAGTTVRAWAPVPRDDAPSAVPAED